MGERCGAGACRTRGADAFSMPGWRSMQRSPNGVSHGASNAHSSSNATSASTLAGRRDSF
ncbi:hypothetical protein WS96_10235 [Burkholderia sp. MSMB1835]|nr:hypothetical protein WS96_10235 [Burkholderia sp. MSMB1835]